jgi:hypothetical protein
MLSKLAFALLLAAASTSATTPKPKAGSYGFNWFDPGSKCRKISAKELAPLKCEVTENAFGLELKSHTCKVNAKVELVIYDTAEHCQVAWETMQANGD